MMKPTPILALLAYGASVNAAVGCLGTLDTFEDITVNAVADAVPLASTPIGAYNGINYSDFVAANEAIQVFGLTPVSGTKVAAVSQATDLLFDKTVTAKPFGTINATTATGTFNLESFYFGCVLDLHTSAADLPESCTISICGTRARGTAVPCEQFTFTVPAVDALGKAPLQLVQPSINYLDVHAVTVSVTAAALGSVVASQLAVVLDNVCHLNVLP